VDRKHVDALVSELEVAEKDLEEVQQWHQEALLAIENAKERRDQLLENLKREVYTKNGPPPGVRTNTLRVDGTTHELSVVYPRSKPFYVPAALPPRLFTQFPLIILEVDTEAVERIKAEVEPQLAEKILQARKDGAWQTPRVSFKKKS